MSAHRWGMLTIEQQPVETGQTENLRRDRACQGRPATDQLFAPKHLLSERVIQ